MHIEKAESGLLYILKEILNIAKSVSINFELLLDLISNNNIESEMLEINVNVINNYFDLIDDELLNMHESFSCSDSVGWVDDIFRNSLALIQAEEDKKEKYIELIKARTKVLTKLIPNKEDRNRIISTSIPFSVSQKLLESIDSFKALGMEYLLLDNEKDQFNLLLKIVQNLEIWCNKNAINIISCAVDQIELDTIRTLWINGTALSEISSIKKEAYKITKEYYGFTLSWLTKAVAQLFDMETDHELILLYSNISKFIELGVPNITAVNLFLSGIRSRVVSTELASLDLFKGKSPIEIKDVLRNKTFKDLTISSYAREWIEYVNTGYLDSRVTIVNYFQFRWNRDGIPDILYIREINEKYILHSSDGYFYEEVESSQNLPFSEVANVNGLYFEKVNESWCLNSRNPNIMIVRDNLDY